METQEDNDQKESVEKKENLIRKEEPKASTIPALESVQDVASENTTSNIVKGTSVETSLNPTLENAQNDSTEKAEIVISNNVQDVNAEKKKRVKAEKTKKEKIHWTKKDLLKRISVTLLISALCPLLLFLSVPFEIFANNSAEFVFTLADFYPVCIGFFFLFWFGIFGILFFLPRLPYRIVSALLIAFAFLFFIQSNYLNSGLSSLQGDFLDDGGGISLTTEVLNGLLWGVVLVLAVVLACLRDKKKILSYSALVISGIIVATQLISPTASAISHPDAFASYDQSIEDGERYVLSDKNINKISTESNIFWFILDKFDESFAEEGLKQDPHIFDELTGFTWFQNHVAYYTHTYPSVARMLTNVAHDPTKSRTSYLEDAFANATPLETLNESGYDVNLYTQAYFGYSEADTLPEYIANRGKTTSYGITNKTGLTFDLTQIALYRTLPYCLKQCINSDSQTSNSYVEEKDADGNVKYNTNSFPEKELGKGGEKGFYFIHTDGCHAAYTPQKGAPLMIHDFKVVNKYIKYLKANGLYDDATIIITGDHGTNANLGKLSKPSCTALFVKPSHSDDKPLKASKAPTHHGNLWATTFKSAGIETEEDFGQSVFEIAEDAQIERTLVSHSFIGRYEAYTYKIVGDAMDFSNWQIIDEQHLNKTLMD